MGPLAHAQVCLAIDFGIDFVAVVKLPLPGDVKVRSAMLIRSAPGGVLGSTLPVIITVAVRPHWNCAHRTAHVRSPVS